MNKYYRKQINKAILNSKTKTSGQVNNINKIDIWLKRISYISQFGLFLITLMTIYFTVIPLYQKAILDEQIAVQTIKLRELNEKAERNYQSLRKLIIKNYITSAYIHCSRLFNIISFEENSKQYDEIDEFGMDVPECLFIKFKQFDPFKNLNLEDLKELKEKVVHLSEELVELKRQAKTEYDGVSSLTEIEIDELRMPIGITTQLNEILDKHKTAEQQLINIRHTKILRKKSEIINAYWNNVRKKLDEILMAE